jgi:hypothetical protein
MNYKEANYRSSNEYSQQNQSQRGGSSYQQENVARSATSTST